MMDFEAVLKIVENSLKSDFGKHLSSKIASFIENQVNLSQSLKAHENYVLNWSKEIKFFDLTESKAVTKSFVELDTYIYPRITRMEMTEIPKVKLVDKIVEGLSHVVVLGQPGSGKTTSSKFLCHFISSTEAMRKKYPFVILVVVRELNDYSTTEKKKDKGQVGIVYRFIQEQLGLKNLNGFFVEMLTESGAFKKEEVPAEIERKLNSLLESMHPLILIEGLDEARSYDMKESILRDYAKLTRNLSDCKVVLTSRTAEYSVSLDRVDVFEIAPLSYKQIVQFSTKWLVRPEQYTPFLEQIRQSPFYDTAIRPLTLAHLCAIYEKIGKIPDKPKTVYRKIIGLLLDEWDQQRQIKRVSKYAKFEVDRKLEFLAELAYRLTISLKRTVFSVDDIKKTYIEMFHNYDLLESEMVSVATELEGHTGLILQAGYRRYEFAHKSLQEFLSAEYIIKLPSLLSDIRVIQKLPNEFAIATTLSSNPSQFFTEIVLGKLTKTQSKQFIITFVNRLLQEKPDFNNSPLILVAFFALYSRYIALENEGPEGQSFLIPVDMNAVLFHRMLAKICEKYQGSKVLQFYREAEVFDSVDDPLVRLELIESKHKQKIPPWIYSRKSFLSS